jgi:drug/metabolite transporter (DMT)-like permease
MRTLSPALFAPLAAALAVTLFSLNDVTMKSLSGAYALHEIVLIRSIVGLVIVVCIMVPMGGGLHTLRTRRPMMHLIRALFVFGANITFFLGLAALPLADCVALFFISPLVITVFSVVFLGEQVGPRRWSAVTVGLIGVGVILRPGTSAFQTAALLPLIAAFGYAGLHIMTRFMRGTENAISMTFYIQVVFIVASVVIGLFIGNGAYSDQSSPSLEFLFRPWIWPDHADLPSILVLGLFASVGGYFISQAYRLGEAALIAPVEYLALPLSILWGMIFFDEWPDLVAWIGIALIFSSGLYSVLREHRQSAPRQTPIRR